MGRFGVADDWKKALDELPLHTKQFADMFRKHGSKQGRNRSDITDTDVKAVPDDLKAAWKTDAKSPRHIYQEGKGRRQDPDNYLDSDYIEAHKKKFEEKGGTRFYLTESYNKYGPGQRDGTTFVIPTSEFDRIRGEAKTPQELGRMLGLGEDFFVKADGTPADITLAQFTPAEMEAGNHRMPSGNEAGANDLWIPGGYLPSGIPEATLDVKKGDGKGTFTDFKF